jgi:predicted RNA-binding Zn ribbon-like protein
LFNEKDPAFALIGEPLAVDLANTDYYGVDMTYDFLGNRRGCQRWLNAAAKTHELPMVSRVSESDAEQLRRLRNAVRTVLLAVVDGHRPTSRRDLHVINSAAAATTETWAIDRTAEGELVAVTRRSGRPVDIALTNLATASVLLLTGPDVRDIRRCARPNCPLLVHVSHHRRRYCGARCANADRQSRYNERVRLRTQ